MVGRPAKTLHDLTADSGGPPPTNPSRVSLASHVFEADGTQHVFYLSDGHIIELFWLGGGRPQVRDLAPDGGTAPLAAGPPKSHVFTAEGTQHVFYVAQNGHIIELWWRPGEPPHPEDLTVQSGGVQPGPFSNALASHVFDAEGTQHVYYTATNHHIVELWWQRGGPKQPEDLTLRSGGAPIANSFPISYVFNSEGTQHVCYQSGSGIIELWFRP